MAYKKIDGDFQVTNGDKAISLKVQVDGVEKSAVVFPKTFQWGTTFSGNFSDMKPMACILIKFVVEAVHFYQTKIKERENAKPVEGSTVAAPAVREPRKSEEDESLIR